MLKKMPTVMIVFCFAVVLALGGCGGSGGGSDDPSSSDPSSSGDSNDTSGSLGVSSGVVVDPYIAGAVVEEIAAGGQVLQTTTTDDQGAYRFEKQLTGGSLLQLKSGNLGQHVGASYRVRLSRRVVEGDAEPIVISPLTTLLSTGVSADELNAALASAGLSDLGQSRLYSDPMAGLAALTEVTDAQLETLQAAMAVGSYLVIAGSEPFDGQLLGDCLAAVATLLNSDTLAQVKSALAADPDIATLTLEDLIHATVIDVRDLVDEVNSGMLRTEAMDSVATDQLVNLATVTKNQHLQRMTGSSGSGISGQLVFENECAGCHWLDGGGAMDLSSKGDLVAGSHRAGSLTSAEIPALAGYLDGITGSPATPEPTPTPTGGEAVFSAKCGTCHTISGGGTMDLSSKGDLVAGSHRAGSLASAEIPALAGYLDSLAAAPPATPEPGPTPTDGAAVFSAKCGTCHTISGGGTMDLSSKGDLVAGSHRAGSLASAEIPALASYLDSLAAAPPATPEPGPTPTDGAAVFSAKCGTCHTISGGGTMDLSSKGDLVAGSHRAGSLTSAEISVLASYLDSLAAAPPSTPTLVDGETFYNNNCSVCHAVNGFDSSGSPDLAGAGQLVADKIAAGHKGFNLTVEQTSALATFLDQYQAAGGDPDTGSCAACHGQPPNGSIFPNTAGAHAAHLALQANSVECSTCHQGATHNDSIELVFPPAYDAQGNVATDNLDGTCSSIICHGGETTPDWWAGSIDVNTQCISCHQRETVQYNSYSSGEHGEHRNYACTVCHNTAKMTGHFGDLSTAQFETDPVTTIGGGTTRVGSYNGTSCSSIACHDSERWKDGEDDD